MNTINAWVSFLHEARTRAGLTQRDLAHRAGTAQSVVARIEGGQSSPTLETFARLLAATGFNFDMELVSRPTADPLIDAFKRDIDRSLLRRNLEKTVDERMRSLQALSRLADEARRAGQATRGKR
jgi:transcriptional regulator with XRE-family HTH domain